MIDKFKAEAYNNSIDFNPERQSKISVDEDPIKKLLNNIINYIDDKKETATLKRNNVIKSTSSNIESEYSSVRSKSGFDINEALNPTEDLEDILKSFNLKRKIKW